MAHQQPAHGQTPDELLPAPPANSAPQLHPGAEVLTADGEVIGRIGELAAAHFKVAATGASDYWLEIDSVREYTPTRVVLNFPQYELDALKLDGPAPADALLSATERQRQRTRMERELERQQARRR